MSFLNFPLIEDNGQDQVTISAQLFIRSLINNQPLQIKTKNGSFCLSFNDSSNATIAGGRTDQFGLEFSGTDRVKLQNVNGDNRIATLDDVNNLIISGGASNVGYWYKFNNNLIVQAVSILSIGTLDAYTYVGYPIAFPNACVGASAFLGSAITETLDTFVTGVNNRKSLSNSLITFNKLVSGNDTMLNLIATGF